MHLMNDAGGDAGGWLHGICLRLAPIFAFSSEGYPRPYAASQRRLMFSTSPRTGLFPPLRRSHYDRPLFPTSSPAWSVERRRFSYQLLDSVRVYLANQKAHHAKQTSQEEFIAILKLHELEYDERYI